MANLNPLLLCLSILGFNYNQAEQLEPLHADNNDILLPCMSDGVDGFDDCILFL